MDKRPIVEFQDPRQARVVSLADYRFSRGKSEQPPTCDHKHVVIDEVERRAYCSECETTVDPFTVLVRMTATFSDIQKDIDDRQRAAQRKLDDANDLQRKSFRRKMAKQIDEVWSGQYGVPCPHCDTVLLPEDFTGKISFHSRHVELERREAEKAAGSLPTDPS